MHTTPTLFIIVFILLEYAGSMGSTTLLLLFSVSLRVGVEDTLFCVVRYEALGTATSTTGAARR